MRDQGHAGLSRQHQPCIGWKLLDGVPRHADAELRSGAPPPRDEAAHDPPPAAGRMAVSKHQYRGRGEVQCRGGNHHGAWRPDRTCPSDGHVDAGASRLSLYRRYSQQPDWPLSAARGRSRMDGGRLLLGEAAVMFDRLLDRIRGKAVTIPPLDGAFRPNAALEECEAVAAATAPDNLCSDGRCVFYSSENQLRRL